MWDITKIPTETVNAFPGAGVPIEMEYGFGRWKRGKYHWTLFQVLIVYIWEYSMFHDNQRSIVIPNMCMGQWCCCLYSGIRGSWQPIIFKANWFFQWFIFKYKMPENHGIGLNLKISNSILLNVCSGTRDICMNVRAALTPYLQCAISHWFPLQQISGILRYGQYKDMCCNGRGLLAAMVEAYGWFLAVVSLPGPVCHTARLLCVCSQPVAHSVDAVCYWFPCWRMMAGWLPGVWGRVHKL